MHKLTILAAAAALAVLTGAAQAQAQRTASPNYPTSDPAPTAE